MNDLLLDTCAVIWTGNGSEIAPLAVEALDRSHDRDKPVYVSPFSAWELGVLVLRGRIRLPQAPQEWFRTYLEKGGLRLADLSADALVASSFLPGLPPRDPADRIIIATARELGLTIVTRDRKILNYATEGHVKALAC